LQAILVSLKIFTMFRPFRVALLILAGGACCVQAQNAPIPVVVQGPIGLRVENERFPDFAHSFFSFWLLRETP
jgi:hypothetical protein